MHTQTESAHEHRADLRPALATAIGLGLYFLTLTGEGMLGASARWLLAYLGAATLGAIVPLGLSAAQLALAVATAPLAWSVIGLLSPGRGRVWRRRLGARRASAEEALCIRDAIETLRGNDPGLPEPSVLYVLDEPLPAAAVRGRTSILSRALIDSDSLAPVLAHELEHVNSLDGLLTEALQRLAIWEDPLRSPRPERGGEGQLEPEGGEGGFLLGCARWMLRLAGGGCAERLLSPLWAAYWRAREYAADAYAASLGQAEELARHLADHELPLDLPQPHLLFNRSEHPPVALRIERLAGLAAGGSK